MSGIGCEHALKVVKGAVSVAECEGISIAVTVCNMKPKAVASGKMSEATNQMEAISKGRAFQAASCVALSPDWRDILEVALLKNELEEQLDQQAGLAILSKDSDKVIGYLGINGTGEADKEIGIKAIRRIGFTPAQVVFP